MPSRRAFLASLGTAAAVGTAGCLSRDRPVRGAWPRAGYDRGQTGHAPDVDGPAGDLTVRWSADVPEGVHTASPVVHDGRVYVGHGTYSSAEVRDVGLRVLDAATGETVRDVTVVTYTGPPTIDAVFWDSVTVADGALYLLAFDGLRRLALDGAEKWHRPLGGGPANSIQRTGHPLVVDGTVYAPTASTTSDTDADEALYAVDAEDGEVLWRHAVPADDFGWTFPPAYADGTVFLTALDVGAFALDAATGDVRWRTGFWAAGPPTVADGRVFVSVEEEGSGSHLVVLDAETGEPVWQRSGGGTWLGRRIAAADGRVYHRQDLGDVVARDAATGEERWRYADATNVGLGTPAVVDGALYVGASTGANGGDDDAGILVLDPVTGDRRGFGGIGADANLDASPAVADGLVFATASFGRAYAFEACSLPVAGRCLA